MDLLHAAPFQGIIPRPYLKGIVNSENLRLRQRDTKRRLFSTSDSFLSFLFLSITEGEKLQAKMEKLEKQYNSLQVLVNHHQAWNKRGFKIKKFIFVVIHFPCLLHRSREWSSSRNAFRSLIEELP